MAAVTVSGSALDHDHEPVPAGLVPELWFRPVKPGIADALFTGREVKADMAPSGYFTVQLESYEGVWYVPYVKWLAADSQTEEMQARAVTEWDPIYPGEGGPISELPTATAGPAWWWVVDAGETVPAGAKLWDWILDPVTGNVYRMEVG